MYFVLSLTTAIVLQLSIFILGPCASLHIPTLVFLWVQCNKLFAIDLEPPATTSEAASYTAVPACTNAIEPMATTSSIVSTLIGSESSSSAQIESAKSINATNSVPRTDCLCSYNETVSKTTLATSVVKISSSLALGKIYLTCS